MVDSDTQKKLDRLAKIDASNRNRSKRYLEKAKRQGKKQISAWISKDAFEKLNRRRDASVQAGKPLSFGGVIEQILFPDINIDIKPMETELDLFDQEE